MGAVLEYDTKALTYVKMRGEEEWSNPSYNAANGKLVAYRSDYATSAETVFKITFKAKEGWTGNANIRLKDISIADGDEEKSIGSASKSITIKEVNSGNNGGNGSNNGSNNGNNPGNPGNSGSNTNQGTNQNQGGNKGTTTKPNTGSSTGQTTKPSNNTATNVNNNVEAPITNNVTEENISNNVITEDTPVVSVKDNNDENEVKEDVKLSKSKQTNNIIFYILCAIAVILVVSIIALIIFGKAKDKKTKKIESGK